MKAYHGGMPRGRAPVATLTHTDEATYVTSGRHRPASGEPALSAKESCLQRLVSCHQVVEPVCQGPVVGGPRTSP